jgi:hypothetical protein
MSNPKPPLQALAEALTAPPKRRHVIARELAGLGRAVMQVVVSGLLLAVFASLCCWALVEIWRQIR